MTESGKSNRDGLLATSLVGLLVFHVVGNAVALATALPRRPAQAAALLVFGATFVYAWRPRYDAGGWIRSPRARWFAGALVAWLAFTAARVALAPESPPGPSGYAMEAAVIAGLWLATGMLAFRTPLSFPGDPAGPEVSTGRVFETATLVLLGFLVAVTYVHGPEPNEVFATFGGSPIQAGAAAAALAGVALSAFRGWRRALALFLAGYLLFVATSRTGLVVLAVLILAHLASTALARAKPRAVVREWAASLALLAICGTLVVAPARLATFYPYLSSRPDRVRVRYERFEVTEWQAFLIRYGRFKLIRPGTTEERAVSRWRLLRGTLRVVRANPWGYWPRPFEEVAELPCGRPPICPYPHNVPLEIGFHFGWVPLVFAGLGTAIVAGHAVSALGGERAPIRVAGAGTLAYLVTAQFSGDLVDSLYPLGFAVVLLLAVVRRRQALPERQPATAASATGGEGWIPPT